MKHLGGLALIILIWSAAGRTIGQGPAEGRRESDVFVAGEGGYHTYRIPSVIVTARPMSSYA